MRVYFLRSQWIWWRLLSVWRGEDPIRFYKDTGEGFIPGCAGTGRSARDTGGICPEEEQIQFVKPAASALCSKKTSCGYMWRSPPQCAGRPSLLWKKTRVFLAPCLVVSARATTRLHSVLGDWSGIPCGPRSSRQSIFPSSSTHRVVRNSSVAFLSSYMRWARQSVSTTNKEKVAKFTKNRLLYRQAK